MADQLIGQTLAGKYRLEEFWRADAASKTYYATQVLIDKPVIIKTVSLALANDAEAFESFQREARILSRIASPHILSVLDFGKDENGLPFLVLDYTEGQTLREVIRAEGGFPLERATSIINQIADALAAAHANNVVHGSLSSDKIIVEQRNAKEFVKVLDIAASNLSADDEQTIIQADLPYYQAPEQFVNDNAANVSSDVYALGVLLYELLTAKLPFTAEDSATLAQKHLQEIPPSLIAVRPDLPPAFEQVVQRALAKQPNQRFHDVHEFAEALKRAASNNGNQGFDNTAYAAANLDVVASDRSAQPVENNLNNPYKTAFIVLAGICLLSVAAIYLTGGFRNTPTAGINADPNSQPVQPLNPASSNGEDLSDLGLQPLNTNTGDPLAIPPGGVTGVPQGIPPGIYPGASGQTVTIPGDSNSVFMQDLNANINVQNNLNAARNVNGNTAVITNTNARPAINANVAPSPLRPNNANLGGAVNSNAAPAPTVAPSQAPRPRSSPVNPVNSTPAPRANSNANGTNQL